jgi:hypothetical protein
MKVRCAPDFRGRTSFRTSSSDTCSMCWSCALAFRAASTCRIVRPKRPRPADPRIVCVLPVDAAHRSIRSDRTSLLWPTVDSRTAAQRKAAQTGAWFTLGAAQQICSGKQALRCAALRCTALHRITSCAACRQRDESELYTIVCSIAYGTYPRQHGRTPAQNATSLAADSPRPPRPARPTPPPAANHSQQGHHRTVCTVPRPAETNNSRGRGRGAAQCGS